MEHLPSDKEAGILPTEIKKLVDSRREVKKLMAAPNISADLRHQVNTHYFIVA
jgi:DNA polymerase alpha subunit A